MTRRAESSLVALARSVQNSYPQIYLACHVDHVRRRGSNARLTSSDASILAHLSFHTDATAGQLARHLGVAASSVSARIKYLLEHGYIARCEEERDRRISRLQLTERGAAACSAASVLDSARVLKLLESVCEEERSSAVEGLACLAQAASRLVRR